MIMEKVQLGKGNAFASDSPTYKPPFNIGDEVEYIPEEEEFAILCRKLAAKSKGWMKTVSSYVISFTKEEQVLLDWNGFVETYGLCHQCNQFSDWNSMILNLHLRVESIIWLDALLVLDVNMFVEGSLSICSVDMRTIINCEEQMKIDELSPWFFPLPSDMCAIAPGSNHDFTRFVYRAAVSSPVTPDDIVDYDMSRRTLSVIQQEEVINISHMTKYHSNNEERSRNELLGTPLKKEDNIQNKEA
ncbi:hypothetical protein FXO38_24606 [Capsicum annuum]|nr:hypothetical protein FXO38_24606 [Capsicum annuum]